MSLLSFLDEYGKTYLPMHMPGGKRSFRSRLPYRWDVTDLEATDDLYRPRGILKDLQEKASSLWHAERSFLLVNGSTGGILSAVRATGPGDLLIGRNAHRSVYNAAELCRRKLHFIRPEERNGIAGSIPPAAVAAALDGNRSVTAVLITSPTYEGVVSDIAAIADICRSRGVPLIVDEAHGAHLGFHSYFPESAVRQGADIVIQSLHKTLPALTQTALLHCRASLAEAVLRELAVFQTSSPSYLLLASADECFRFLESPEPFARYAERLDSFRRGLSGLARLTLLDGRDFHGYDPGKLVFLTGSSLSGKQCADWLRTEEKVETELSAPGYFLAMTSVCDPPKHFRRFGDALRKLDAVSPLLPGCSLPSACGMRPEKVMEPFDVRSLDTNICSFISSPSRISADYVWAYPPGVPLLIPGERIPEEVPDVARAYAGAGVPLRTGTGTEDTIAVCADS